jgi:hypothetical protein
VSNGLILHKHISRRYWIFSEKDINPDPSCVPDRKCAEMILWKGQEAKKEYAKMIRDSGDCCEECGV